MGKKHRLMKIVCVLLLLYLAYRFIWPVLAPRFGENGNVVSQGEEQIADWMEDLGVEEFVEQAQEKYQEYSTQLVEGANEAINEAVESAAKGAAESFFESLKQSAQDFWNNLVSGDSDGTSE